MNECMALRLDFQIRLSIYLFFRRVDQQLNRLRIREGKSEIESGLAELTHILKNHIKTARGPLYNIRGRSIAGDGALVIKNRFHRSGVGQNDDSPIKNLELLTSEIRINESESCRIVGKEVKMRLTEIMGPYVYAHSVNLLQMGISIYWKST